MKKLFFTAILLVAFSGVSMAKTIENKELESDKRNCNAVFQNALGGALASGLDADAAWSVASAAYSFCVFQNQGI